MIFSQYINHGEIMGLEDLVSKMNEKNQFERVCVDRGVIDSVVFYSKKCPPSYNHEVTENRLRNCR